MISVLISAYNSEKYIAEAIESILAQTYQDYEIIVVDDGSTDNTAQIIKSFSPKVKYFYQTNVGAGAARNTCVKLSKGEFLAFLDADDVWTKTKLERQVQEFSSDSKLEAVFGMVKQVRQKDWNQRLSEDENALFKGFIQGTMLIKKSSFLSIGMFPENRKVGEFVDWLLRAKESDLQMNLLSELFLIRRIHETNLGIQHRDSISDYVKILKDSIDRRRLRPSN